MNDLRQLMLQEPRLTLAVAESVTCGRVQALIGSISGASDFFVGGITCYTIDQKVRHLGVNRPAAQAVDSVSAAVAEQMARGACRLFGSDLAVATTGYAEASPKKGVRAPFAFWAVARRMPRGTKVRSGRLACAGLTRVGSQEELAQAALGALIAWVREQRAV